MENKIDIAAILKDCPRGMELDCTTWFNVTFEKVVNDEIYIKRNNKVPSFDQIVVLNKYGCCTNHQDEKCRIFPKGKKSWEGFQRPFKDGDIIADDHGNIAIYKGMMWYNKKLADYYCGYRKSDDKFLINESGDRHVGMIEELHYASKEEKQKLFDAIRVNGYRWDAETKTLEKLIKPKFKVDDKIVNNGYIVVITDIFTDDQVYGYKSKMGGIGGILFTEQDEWELVPDKFDVTTLKPYDKVLARCSSLEKWRIQFFEKFDKTCKFPFICMGYNKYNQCVPYEGNEHLLDTADSCSDYYLI